MKEVVTMTEVQTMTMTMTIMSQTILTFLQVMKKTIAMTMFQLLIRELNTLINAPQAQ